MKHKSDELICFAVLEVLTKAVVAERKTDVVIETTRYSKCSRTYVLE